MYIWQQPLWPLFFSDDDLVRPRLDEVLALQSRLVKVASALPEDVDQGAELDALIQSAIKTSEIEGEHLNEASVRSSVARQLGIEQAGLPESAPQEESLVKMLVAAVSDLGSPLSNEMLCEWQEALFPQPSLLQKIRVGEFRDDATGPMQVVSGSVHAPKVHYQAPPAADLEGAMNDFLCFYNDISHQHHGIIRAAIAHFQFITIHPFDDGNGRIARALTDRALAQSENSGLRFYSLSAAIAEPGTKNAYYDILEATQNCRNKDQQDHPMDITPWLLWFLDTLEQAINTGFARLDRVLRKANFWKVHGQTVLTGRQVKVLNRLLDSHGLEFMDGIAARHYKSIAGVSKATATRDIMDLVEKGCLLPLAGGGRSSRYVVNTRSVGGQ